MFFLKTFKQKMISVLLHKKKKKKKPLQLDQYILVSVRRSIVYLVMLRNILVELYFKAHEAV